MTLTLKIDPTLEQRLREHAARRGLEPDSYAVAAIREQLRRDRVEPPHLSGKEADLLQQINLGFSSETWDRYDSLISKRENLTLTPPELDELRALTEQLETQNVRRIDALVELARLRDTTLEALMDALQIKPHERRSD
ncbi:MAG TPA: hypothetical protein VK797_00665 [Tepidisphaeraceae bacterium]|jgi:hypothetical protein|nr:hypothetical protein [Tepidisphaeraceae bacterium]